jgi:hypothetical protein
VSSNLTWTLPATDGASGEALTTNGSGTLSWAAATPTIASTAEAEAGTNNTNFITPLRMREGFNASGSAPVYACRAWMLYDGSAQDLRGSGNVSSVTRNGTGDYTMNFSTAMPSDRYAPAGSAGVTSSITTTRHIVNFSLNSTSYRFSVQTASGALADADRIGISIHI